MDLTKVLEELRKERDAIDAAIVQLERLERVGLRSTHRPAGLNFKSHVHGSNGALKAPIPPLGQP